MSKHFELEPLTDGVYAVIARDEGAACSNAGIIDLGDRVLLFDALGTPQAARDLVIAAEQLTDRPPTLAINSHWHAGHVLGNQALPPTATIICTPRTRTLIATRAPSYVTSMRQEYPRRLRELETRLQAELDSDRRQAIGEQIDFLRLMLHDLPALSVRLPALTFEHRLVIHGTARSVEVLALGGGHTDSDAILVLPDDQIVFMGDLLSYERHPWLGDGDLDAWLGLYDQIERDIPFAEVIVPGHGPVTTPDAFAELRRYIPALRHVVAEVLHMGGGEADALRQPVPAAFSAWSAAEHFTQNIRCCFQQACAVSG